MVASWNKQCLLSATSVLSPKYRKRPNKHRTQGVYLILEIQAGACIQGVSKVRSDCKLDFAQSI